MTNINDSTEIAKLVEEKSEQLIQASNQIEAGLVLLPAAAIMMIVMPIVEKLYNQVGAFWLVTLGMGIIAYSQW